MQHYTAHIERLKSIPKCSELIQQFFYEIYMGFKRKKNSYVESNFIVHSRSYALFNLALL